MQPKIKWGIWCENTGLPQQFFGNGHKDYLYADRKRAEIKAKWLGEYFSTITKYTAKKFLPRMVK